MQKFCHILRTISRNFQNNFRDYSFSSVNNSFAFLPQVQLWALGSPRETVLGRPAAADLRRLAAALADLEAGSPAGPASPADAAASGS